MNSSRSHVSVRGLLLATCLALTSAIALARWSHASRAAGSMVTPDDATIVTISGHGQAGTPPARVSKKHSP